MRMNWGAHVGRTTISRPAYFWSTCRIIFSYIPGETSSTCVPLPVGARKKSCTIFTPSSSPRARMFPMSSKFSWVTVVLNWTLSPFLRFALIPAMAPAQAPELVVGLRI